MPEDNEEQVKTGWNWKWLGIGISCINCVVLLIGFLGGWRDRIVLSDAKQEQLTVTVGEIKGQLQTVIAQGNKNENSQSLVQQSVVRAESDIAETRQEIGKLADQQAELTQRVGVLEQRNNRGR